MHPIGSERGVGDGGRRQEAVAACGDFVLGTDDPETAVTDATCWATESLDWTIWDVPTGGPPPSGYRAGAGVVDYADTGGDTPTGPTPCVPPGSLFFPGVVVSTYPGAGDQDE